MKVKQVIQTVRGNIFPNNSPLLYRRFSELQTAVFYVVNKVLMTLFDLSCLLIEVWMYKTTATKTSKLAIKLQHKFV